MVGRYTCKRRSNRNAGATTATLWVCGAPRSGGPKNAVIPYRSDGQNRRSTVPTGYCCYRLTFDLSEVEGSFWPLVPFLAYAASAICDALAHSRPPHQPLVRTAPMRRVRFRSFPVSVYEVFWPCPDFHPQFPNSCHMKGIISPLACLFNGMLELRLAFKPCFGDTRKFLPRLLGQYFRA